MSKSEKPTECSLCHGKNFWYSKWGEYICEKCHPSPSEDLKEKIIGEK